MAIATERRGDRYLHDVMTIAAVHSKSVRAARDQAYRLGGYENEETVLHSKDPDQPDLEDAFADLMDKSIEFGIRVGPVVTRRARELADAFIDHDDEGRFLDFFLGDGGRAAAYARAVFEEADALDDFEE